MAKRGRKNRTRTTKTHVKAKHARHHSMKLVKRPRRRPSRKATKVG